MRRTSILVVIPWAFFLAVGNTAGQGWPGFVAPQAFPAGSLPSAVAGGDVNGDGIPDLAVSNSTSPGAVTVLLGKGGGMFQRPKTFSTGGNGNNSLVLADLNGDRNLDAAVASCGSGTVSVLRGTGSGRFRFFGSFPAGVSPQGIVTADFNGDGKLDLAVANAWNGTGGTVSVLLGRGDGTFLSALHYVAGSPYSLASLASADFDGDGWPDLAAAYFFFSHLIVLINAN